MEFEWHTRNTYLDQSKIKPNKILRKLPMEKKVIDNDGRVFLYHIDRITLKPIYLYLFVTTLRDYGSFSYTKPQLP